MLRRAELALILSGISTTSTPLQLASGMVVRTSMSDQLPPLEPNDVDNEFQQGIVAPCENSNPKAEGLTEPTALPSIPQLSDFNLTPLDGESNQMPGHPIDFLRDIELNVNVELGRTRLELDDVRRLQSGTVVALDRRTSEPVDVVVNGQLLARGEVIVMDGKLCVRVNEIVGSEAA